MGERLGKCLVMASNKGGTGKSTIAETVGAALANKGKKVLLVDCDAQCNSTRIFFGKEKPEFSLYHLFKNMNEKEVDIKPEQMTYATSYENLFIIPNIQATAMTEVKHYEAVPVSYGRMKRFFQDYCRTNFDYTIVDTAPNLGFFLVNPLMMADAVYIPVEAGSQFAIDGLYNLVAFIRTIAKQTKAINNIGIIINKADRRTNASRSVILTLKSQFGDFLCKSMIPRSTSIEQAQMYHETVLRHAPTTPAAKIFRKLADEIHSQLND